MSFNTEAATQAYLATLSPEALAASKAYTTGGYWLILWGLLVAIVVTVILVRWGILATLRDRLQRAKPRPNLMTFCVTAAFISLSWLLTLPWSIYAEWFRERAYNLSHQPFGDWLMQSLISTIVNMILFGAFFVGLYALIRRVPRGWPAWGGMFAGAAMMFGLLIAPVFVMPLFNDYTPMPEGPVKDAVVALARDSNVPTDKIFVFDGSRQRSVLTANVSGFLGTAQISVSDVALKEATLAEVCAVVAHEIGHYVSNDLFSIIALIAILAALGFVLTQRLFGSAVRILNAKGVADIFDPAGVPVLVLLLTIWLTLCQPVLNTMSREFEAGADFYSLNHAQEPDGLASALIKTAEYRDPTPPRFAEMLFHNHPAIIARVRMGMEWKAAHPIKDAPPVETELSKPNAD